MSIQTKLRIHNKMQAQEFLHHQDPFRKKQKIMTIRYNIKNNNNNSWITIRLFIHKLKKVRILW